MKRKHANEVAERLREEWDPVPEREPATLTIDDVSISPADPQAGDTVDVDVTVTDAELRFPERTKVAWDKYQSAVVYRKQDCGEMGYQNCTCCDRVMCPICILQKDVEVTDRRPLVDDADDDEGVVVEGSEA